MANLIPAPTKFPVIPDFQSVPFVTGFEINITDDTKFTVNPGACRAMTSDFVIAYPSFNESVPGVITVDISTVGVNGCYPVSIDSLALANKTLMGVYAIAKSSGTTNGSLDPNIAAGIVVATGNNFLPAGYDVFRRIGFVYVDDATGFLIWMSQAGHGNERSYMLEDTFAVVSAGNATTATPVDLSINDGIVPPGAHLIYLGLTLDGNAANSYLQIFPTGDAVNNPVAGLVTPDGGGILGASDQMICGVNSLGNASIDYLVDNAGSAANIYVKGFADSLGLDLF